MTNYELRMDIKPDFQSIYEFAIRNLGIRYLILSQTLRERSVPPSWSIGTGRGCLEPTAEHLGQQLTFGLHRCGVVLFPWCGTLRLGLRSEAWNSACPGKFSGGGSGVGTRYPSQVKIQFLLFAGEGLLDVADRMV